MRRAAEVLLFLAVLGGLAAASPRRLVGDGVEYAALALNLSAGRPPAFSQADLEALRPSLVDWAGGPAFVSLDWPVLVGRDGRQGTPHSWIYPLLVAPVLLITSRAQLHPQYAFFAVNLALMACAWVALRRHATAAVATLVLAGPVLWWIDKAHTEVFVYSLLVLAFSLAARGSAVAVAVAGLAVAQNSGLVVAAAAVLAETLRARPTRGSRRPLALMCACGAALSAVVPLYNWTRGVPAFPLAAWTWPHVPSGRELLTPLIDLNVGLLARAPVTSLALAVFTLLALRPARWAAAASSALSCAGVLAVVAQSTNVNHGATPGLSRYALWLVPLLLPVLLRLGPRHGRATCALVAASVAACLVSFRPSLPEVYRYPGAAAALTWERWPALENPLPEVFAERVSHREPSVVPTATDTCSKVLLLEGRWPAPCLPAQGIPAECRQPSRWCYANRSGGGEVSFAVVPPSVFPYERHLRTWADDDPFMPALRRVLRGLGAPDLARASTAGQGSMVRAVYDVAWSTAWQSPDRLLVFLASPRDAAAVTLRTPSGLRGELRDLSSDTSLRTLEAPPRDGEAWTVQVPPVSGAMAIVLRRP